MIDISGLSASDYVLLVNKWHRENKRKHIYSWTIFTKAQCWRYWK